MYKFSITLKQNNIDNFGVFKVDNLRNWKRDCQKAVTTYMQFRRRFLVTRRSFFVTDGGSFFVIPNGEKAASALTLPSARVISFQTRFRRAIRAKLATGSLRVSRTFNIVGFNIKDDRRHGATLRIQVILLFRRIIRSNIGC